MFRVVNEKRYTGAMKSTPRSTPSVRTPLGTPAFPLARPAAALATLWLAACAGGTSDGGCASDDECGRGLTCVDSQCRAPEAPPDDDAANTPVGDAFVVRRDANFQRPDAGPITADAGPPPDGGMDAVAAPGDQGPIDDGSPGPDAAGPSLDGTIVPPDGPLPDAAPGPCAAGEVRDCGRNVGRCRAGRQQCQPDGTWGVCQNEVAPQDEICNGQDDDCNGVVDDGFRIGEACQGIGTCGPGVLECRNNLATRCSTDPGGSRAGDDPETCDGTDEDCDGRADEDFMLGLACAGRCGGGRLECAAAGDQICSTDPGGSGFAPGDEQCNGRDDNCDGQVDEIFALGQACEGAGACGAGRRECDAGGSGRSVCSSEPGGTASEARAELCNAVDDDCDGETDEDFAVGIPCDGVGECGAGVSECSADGRLICSTDPGGSQSRGGVERCNDRDDDCDGEVDEGLRLGEPCPALGICPAGVRECAPNEGVTCSTGPGGSADVSEVEVCNGIDDDCDGALDEDFMLGGACDGQGACGVGVRECGADGVSRCSTEPGGTQDQATPEGCDGLDNDCDGAVDDGAACGGDTCGTAPGLVFTEGVTGNTAALANDYATNTCVPNTPGNDQVYRFDTPAQGRYVVGVAPLAANYDTLFWVSGDCPQPSTCLPQGGRDLAGAGRPEVRAVDIPRADTFYAVVDSRSIGGGPFLAMVRPFGDGEDCGTAIALTAPGRFVGTTEGRANDVAGQACPAAGASTGPDQVFVITPDRAGRLNVALTPGPAIRFILSLTTSCATPDAACNAGAIAPANGQPVQISANVEAGTAYYLVIDHIGAPGGAFFLDVTLQ
jgi:hypothetical protein